MRYRILVSCHKDCSYAKSEIYTPIQVGTAVKGHHYLENMLHDDVGDNISAKNPEYCEVTAQYWAWKNLDAEYYGFCHYRRYFNFSGREYKEDGYGNIIEPFLGKKCKEKYGWTDARVEECLKDADLITTSSKDLRSLEAKGRTPREQYRNAPKLHYEDFERMLEVLAEKFPDYAPAARRFADGHVSCFCNMFIMRRDLFIEYSEWLFDVLEEFCRRSQTAHYSTEALRTPGHLAERLFNIWLLHLMETNPGIRRKELQCVLIEDTEKRELTLQPAFQNNCVPVVFAANNYFVPMFAACYQSMLEQITAEYNYDVVLISTDISKENKETLLQMGRGFSNVSLRFYHPGILLEDYQLQANAHISVETYYRFLIQTVLPDYEKVLYLDCDTIIAADVAELYQTDLDGYLLAAVRDVDFTGQINGANRPAMKYAKEKLGLKNPYDYFQAGILLFNEKEMRETYTLDEWLRFASESYQYNDQDVLNKYCEGRVKFLNMSWNLLTDCDHYRVKNVISYAPDEIQKEYQEARRHPKIIHYAGFMKPWHRPTEDYAHEFWKYARKTDYYEELLFRLDEGITDWKIRENSAGRENVERRRNLVNILFPRGTGRRAWLDGWYVRIFRR
jgi:lipopolysaccharide biosynthesis glycosyltransferase